MDFLPRRTRNKLVAVQEKLEFDTPEEDALYQCLQGILELQTQLIKARTNLILSEKYVDAVVDLHPGVAALDQMRASFKDHIRQAMGVCTDKRFSE